MKKKNVLLSFVMAFALIAVSCGKNNGGGSSAAAVNREGTDAIETTPVPNHSTKSIDLGIAKSFALMAYTSITSVPTSNISGKVGLKPGGKAVFTLQTSEVEGGSSDIYLGDEEGDKQDYLTLARQDLITAYRDAEARATDKDKMNPWGGDVNGRDLPPGTWRLGDGVSFDKDTTLKGNESDVWIFQVNGNLTLADNVKLNLEGAQAKNIFWQVSGKVTVGAGSFLPGTVISQLTFELKKGAKVRGRVFCKNGKVILDQNTIRP